MEKTPVMSLSWNITWIELFSFPVLNSSQGVKKLSWKHTGVDVMNVQNKKKMIKK